MARTASPVSEAPRRATRAEACEALCRVLESGDGAHRCFAARSLGRIGRRAAVDALIEALRDQDEDVRADAAAALGLLGERRAAAALLQNLAGDPCGEVKVNAVNALGRLGDPAAIPQLKRLIVGRDEENVVWDEAEALASGWDDWLDVQVRAIEALAALGAGDAVDDIVSVLRDEMGQNLSAVVPGALSRMGGAGIRALASFLQVADERLRRGAAKALARVDSDSARTALALGLSDSTPEVRLTALRGLANHDPSDPRLSGLFDDPDGQVAATATRLCGACHPGRLDRLLDSPSDEVQLAAIEVLTANPALAWPKDLIGRLRVKLRGPSPEVAALVAPTLAALAPEVAFDDLKEQVLDRACPSQLRAAAARALIAFGSEATVATLAQCLDDDRQQVRLAVMTALAGLARSEGSDGRAHATLFAALGGPKDSPPEEKIAAEPTLASGDDGGDTDSPRSAYPTSTLDAILADREPVVAAAAQDGSAALTPSDLAFLELTQVAPRAKHPAIEPSDARHEDVRRLAARVLGEVPDPETARALATVLGDDDRELRRSALDSLARLAEQLKGLADDVAGAVAAALSDGDRAVRLAAVHALSFCRQAIAVAPLTGRLKDEDSFVRARAVRGLARFGTELAEHLDDEDSEVRLAAARAVAIGGGSDALDRLIDFAFAFDGAQRNEAARLLRRIDPFAANARFIETLKDPNRRRLWRIAIEALGEVNRKKDALTPVDP